MIGRRDGDESSPEGPMSFAVGASGDVYVLDQVSARVVHFAADGAMIGEIPLPGDTFQDVEVAPDGRVLVLDRLVRQSVLIIDEVSGATTELPIAGDGIPEGGAVTALLSRRDGVWLEVEHRRSVRVLDDQLAPCVRSSLPGRPSARTGRGLVARLDGSGGAEVALVAADGAVEQRIQVVADGPIARIAWVEDDARGALFVAVHVVRYDATGLDVVEEHTEGHVYADTGERLARFSSPHVITEWEQLRELDLGDDGGLYQLAILPHGPQVLRFGRLSDWR